MAAKTTTTSLGQKPYSSPYYSIGKEICQNLYLEFAQSADSKANFYLIKIPGLKRFGLADSASFGACRGLITTGAGRTFGVFGQAFMEILQDGTRSVIGTVGSGTRPVSMAENGYQLIVVDGTGGWIYEYVNAVYGPTWTRITDEFFPGNSQATTAPTHVAYIDTYFLVNITGTNQYYWSESYYKRAHDDTSTDYDPTQPNGYWNPISSGLKIGRPGNITALCNCNNYLWLFGADGNEVHYDTGNYDTQLFARYDGAILNFGCNAPYSVATYANSVFWLASDVSGTLGVFTNEGMQPKRISTRGIEQIIQEFSIYSDCIGFAYAQSGHSFYVMHFPTVSRTFVYDQVADAWHERTYLDQDTGALYQWRGMFATHNFDALIMGDATWSGCYTLEPTYYLNDDITGGGVNYIRCVKNTPILFQDGMLVVFRQAQIVCNQGSGLPVDTAEGVGQNPTVQLAWSDDTGVSYEGEDSAEIGRIGEYTARSIFYGLGAARNRVFRITMSDPVPFILVSLIIKGEAAAF